MRFNWKEIINKSKIGILENIYQAKLKSMVDGTIYSVVVYNDGSVDTITEDKVEQDNSNVIVYQTISNEENIFELLRDRKDIIDYCMEEFDELVEYVDQIAEDFEMEEN